MARYLVTGGCGFVGTHLVARLVDNGHQVTVLDDCSVGNPEHLPASASLTIGDVRDLSTVTAALSGMDGCFHLAAVNSVERTFEEWSAASRVNCGGLVNVLEAARRAREGGPIPVVYASSAAVYGENQTLPLAETMETLAVTPYAADKRAGELHARVADALFDVPAIGFRLFNVYGPRQNPRSPDSGVITIFGGHVLAGESITIFGDGEQQRDFVFVGDVLWYLTAAMDHPRRGAPVYNVCTGIGTTVNRLAELIGELTGRPVERQYAPPRGGDLRASVGNPTRSITEFGFACDTQLREGLRTTLTWIEGHGAG